MSQRRRLELDADERSCSNRPRFPCVPVADERDPASGLSPGKTSSSAFFALPGSHWLYSGVDDHVHVGGIDRVSAQRAGLGRTSRCSASRRDDLLVEGHPVVAQVEPARR